jgi:glycosyltransferase involved in cell wall biosynthesis
MRVLALVEQADHVCYRYRIQAYVPWWQERGWYVEAEPAARGTTPFFRQLAHAAQADITVLQRRLLPRWKLLLLRRMTNVLIFDVDDAVFLRDSNSPKPPKSRRRWNRFRWTARCCDAVLAGNRFLADRARETGSRAFVYFAPTCVEIARYAVAGHHRSGHDVKLVWIGSRSTLPSLVEAADGLRAINRLLPGVETRIICDTVPKIEGVNVIARPWSSETECRDLSDSDIGISYLPEHPWSLGKCGLKVLQYMAAGLPVLANPVGVHLELVADGKTGFLCRTADEWASAAQTLAGSPELRRRMGRQARATIERHFSTKNHAEFLLKIFDKLVNRQESDATWRQTR